MIREVDWLPWVNPQKDWAVIIYYGPRDKFHCIHLATQQEIGLFVLKSLPRMP